MVHELEFELAGIQFFIKTDDLAYVKYFEAFLGAYSLDSRYEISSHRVTFSVISDNVLEIPDYASEVAIHSSTYPGWNVRGLTWISGKTSYVHWLSKGITIGIIMPSIEYEAYIDRNADKFRVGEWIFTACRNIAVYLRQRSLSFFLHASSVVFGERAVLFLGESGSGKTSLLLNSIMDYNAEPLSNDRTIVRSTEAIVNTWPGYFTISEEMLCRFPKLYQSSIDYENWYAFKTTSWSSPPEPLSGIKRLYPMHWLVDSLGIRYRRRAKLGMLVFSAVSDHAGPSYLRKLAISDDSIARRIEENCFDKSEESFSPWHGLTLTGSPLNFRELVQSWHQHGVEFYNLRLASYDFSQLQTIQQRCLAMA